MSFFVRVAALLIEVFRGRRHMRFPTVKLEPFVPRGDSPWIFAITMASYSWITEDFVRLILAFFDIISPSSGLLKWSGLLFYQAISGLLVAPILETCVLIGTIELLRWLKSPGWLQVLLSTAILVGLHAVGRGPLALIVMPSFAIQGASYLWWRPMSQRKRLRWSCVYIPSSI